MIISKLTGGLGNQLFQYALGRHLSIKNKQEFKIDISNYGNNIPDPNKGVRIYSLNNFNIISNKASAEDLVKFSQYFGNDVKTKITRKLNRMRKFYKCSYVVEPEVNYFRFRPELLSTKINKNVYLEGYWQSEKYFLDIEKTIREDFSFKNIPDDVNARFIDEIRKTESVAIHVRRGDNVHLPASGNGVLSMEYYKVAINKLVAKIKNPSFFVFSDDPEWVQKNLKINYPTQYISHNGDEKNFYDLMLMSNCYYHIIGNSTFSWWGAWLGKNPKQIVFAPKSYHIGEDISDTDYYPLSWNLI